jgi:hypothetical protein
VKDTGLSVTLTGLEIRSQCHLQGRLVEEDCDPLQELAGAAFLIVVAFGGFVSLVVAICWTIAR